MKSFQYSGHSFDIRYSKFVIRYFFRLFILILYVSASPSGVIAQDEAIVRTYGGPYYEEGRQIIECSDYGYIVIGTTGSDQLNNTDFYLLRLDDDLNCVWSKNLGGVEVEWGYSIVEDAFGTFYICGYTNSFGNGAYDALVYRVDANGEIIWQHTYGGTDWDFVYKIIAHPTSGFLLCGKTYSQGAGSSDGWLFHIDAFGNMVDEWVYGGLGEDEFVDVEVTEDGRVVCGGNEIINDGSHAKLTKLNIDGSIIWENNVESDYETLLKDVLISDTNYVITGIWRDGLINKDNFYLNKYTEDYALVWSHFESVNGLLSPSTVIGFEDGYFSGGTTDEWGAGETGFLIQRRGLNGVWQMGPTFGGVFLENGLNLLLGDDGSLFLLGNSTSYSESGLFDLYLVQLPSTTITQEYPLDLDYLDCFSVAINELDPHASEFQCKGLYTLLGQRVENSTPINQGVYIEVYASNGRLMIRKKFLTN
ncbi:MAG: hypothetical protein SH856_03995 [Flavobacteriales bacterium]|nr:hypothetical protein [Flavobacteriales bacterium]